MISTANNDNNNYSEQTLRNNSNVLNNKGNLTGYNDNNNYSQQTMRNNASVPNNKLIPSNLNENSNYSEQTFTNNSNVYVKTALKYSKTNSMQNIKSDQMDKFINFDQKNTTRGIRIPNDSFVSQTNVDTGYSLNTNRNYTTRNQINSIPTNTNTEFHTINNNYEDHYVNIEDLMLLEEKLSYIIYVLFC